MKPHDPLAASNRLIHELSPYLLQHAHNPVDWYPWGEDAFEKARTEDKLVLISIGYSSCHWCHVMERESFEDAEVAAVMNQNFVCIKVDREERPDIDQIYMNAVQLMTGQGGWPLNCFALPDGRPVYGGTYFQKSKWIELLDALSAEYARNKPRFEEYADQLTKGVQESELVKLNPAPQQFDKTLTDQMIEKWKRSFDPTDGGPNRAPKFPLPSNYDFLLRYGVLTQNTEVLNHVSLTLDKMAMGGIFDQAGGGFARYSTDSYWKVPHFEKMLYDNAQLIALYAQAYAYFGKRLYRETAEASIAFVLRDLSSESGWFFSALDADSEGEEGKYYVWNLEELKSALSSEELNLALRLYEIDKAALWEHGNNILLLRKPLTDHAREMGISEDQLWSERKKLDAKLMAHRCKRISPGLDDKSLTSWNAMMVSALCQASAAFGNKDYLAKATSVFQNLMKYRLHPDGHLWHSGKEAKAYISGFLEDYAFVIDAAISLYAGTGNSEYLNIADTFTQYTLLHFADPKNSMFFFTSDQGENLIARKMEVSDNVIPAANSVMANNLFKLGHLLQKEDYTSRSAQMLHNVNPDMLQYPPGYSHWANLHLSFTYPYYEVVISGPDAQEMGAGLTGRYLPNTLCAFSTSESELPLFKGRYSDAETRIFVCVNNTCRLPVNTAEEAFKMLMP
jgi:uncharacterized protein YyaL (SSP411 family)